MLISVCETHGLAKENTTCSIPQVIQGSWYSWENGRSTTTEINATSMSKRGNCVQSSMAENKKSYIFVFEKKNIVTCYTIVKIILRTTNVLDKIESKSIESTLIETILKL